YHEPREQLPQPQAPAVLRWHLAVEPRVNVLRVDRLRQPRQLPPQVARPPETPLQQRLLKPAVEVLHAAVELGLPSRDEYGADTNGTRKSLKPLAASVCAPACAVP